MSAKKFLTLSLFGFVLLMGAYVSVVDNLLIPKRELPFPYKQFLLESSADIKGKVIIESGSNSLYGIEPFVLSKYFNAPVITIANNAGYPLRPKIFNIEKFIAKGDIVLLALEWNHYADSEQMPHNFIKSLANENLSYEYYFNNLPFFEKLRFIFTQYPISMVLNTKFFRDKKTMLRQDMNRLPSFRAILNSGSAIAFGNAAPIDKRKNIDTNVFLKCDNFLFYKGFEVSNVFRENLVLLKRLREKGASVYFLWPSVVDGKRELANRCYLNPKVSSFVNEIKLAVEKEGFQFIGDYQQSHSLAECFLDTNYHIKYECGKTRTQTLIKEFQALNIGSIPLPSNQDTFKKQANTFLDRAAFDLQKKLTQLELADNPENKNGLSVLFEETVDKLKLFLKQKNARRLTVTHLGKLNLSKQLVFSNGWTSLRSWGIWSAGKESTVSFSLGSQLAKKKSLRLILRGTYTDGQTFNQIEKTKVTINGVSFGYNIPINKPLTIPGDLLVNREIKIHLQYFPKLEKGKVKKLSFGLTGVDLLSGTD